MANYLPHFKMPFQFGPSGGSPQTCDQDSQEDIITCVENLLRYNKGFREDLPEFGIPDMSFESVPINVGVVIDAILKYEPRAAPIVSNEVSLIEEMVDRILVGNE